MKRLRAAVVGVGYLGNFHAQKYKAHSQVLPVDLLYVCDANPEQAKKIASELSVQAVTSPEELIGKVDLVTVASTTTTHYELAKLFLNNNIHVNVEKPMTVTTNQATELIEIAKANNLKLAVGHSERFSPVFKEIKIRMKNPMSFELSRHAPYKARGADVSVLHDLMIHDLDLLFNLDPSSYEISFAQGSKHISPTLDWATVGFRFQSGRSAVISVSRLAQAMTRTLRVSCEKQNLFGNFQSGDIEISGSSAEVINAGKSDNLLVETEVFIRSVSEDAPLQVKGDDGLKALQAVEKIESMILSRGP